MSYSADNIKVLQGLEAVRKRPGMYIGSTDIKGLHHLVWEIFDNSIDEVLAGYCDEIRLTIHKDNSIEISDNGRGIPTEINKTTNISTVETVFTNLHAGGKFDSKTYQVSGGLHGVGSSVVNALSEFLTCTVYRNKEISETKFINGGSETSQKLTKIGNTNKTGTHVIFKPDKLIFETIKFDPKIIEDRLREASFLFKKLKIIFNDEINKNKMTFYTEKGIIEFVEYINQHKEKTSPVIYLKNSFNDIEVEIAIQYSNDLSETIVSFANSIKTIEGGSHETGFKTSLVDVFNEYAKKWNIFKAKDKKFDSSDVRESIASVISLKIPEALISFEGQTKNKLYTPLAKEAVRKVCETQLKFWFEENRKSATILINKACEVRDIRENARKSREAYKKTKSKTPERMLSGKLTPCQDKNPKNSEIFLVEGDSAGGSAKLGRNKKNQAILPLKGKVINTERTKVLDVLKNEEINTIIACLGTGIFKNLDVSKLKYHKIIIMTDADNDGAHIQILLLTLFYRYMKPLIEEGHIYIALPPLYKISNKKNTKFQYAWLESELNEIKKEYTDYEIQRYKGLGEMNADQLWETTMNPETRKLIKVTISDAILAERQVSTLMGDNIVSRKEWIEKNINFNSDEGF